MYIEGAIMSKSRNIALIQPLPVNKDEQISNGNDLINTPWVWNLGLVFYKVCQ